MQYSITAKGDEMLRSGMVKAAQTLQTISNIAEDGVVGVEELKEELGLSHEEAQEILNMLHRLGLIRPAEYHRVADAYVKDSMNW